jgi:hypothetical protein
MVNKRFWLGILVLALVLGMTVVGCDDGSTNGGGADSALNGTWTVSLTVGTWERTNNNGNFETRIDGIPSVKGTYTTDNGILTSTTTHYWGGTYQSLGLDARWYTRAELQTVLPNLSTDVTSVTSYPYSVSGNTVILTGEDGTVSVIWTRKQ